LKKIIFLIIASLLVIGLVLPGMVGAATPTTIEVIIAGPMTNIQGLHMWYGAQLANTEIGTITGPGPTQYVFHLNQVDTKEIADPTGSGAILATALTTTGAKMVIGGFRTEGAVTQIPVACAANATFFICGSASYGLMAIPGLLTSTNYSAGGKYIFRGTPFNDIFLVNNAFMMLQQVVLKVIASGVASPKVAIFAEDLTWTTSMVATASALMPLLGATLGPVKKVSDTATAGQVIPALNEIKAAKCHIILTFMSGPVGSVFSTQKGALDIPAMAVGINVAAQDPSFWEASLGNCAYEITMGTWAPNVSQTSKTAAFLTAFQTTYSSFPIYTASSHDILLAWAENIKAVGYNPANLDPNIQWFENPANALENTSALKAAYYPKWVYPSFAWWKSAGKALPSLNSTQYNALYGTLGYSLGTGTNFTMPPYSTHDLVYGPGYVTGIANQWIPVVAG
jgi:branched-chain amino acid transport system substrate-binding protein